MAKPAVPVLFACLGTFLARRDSRAPVTRVQRGGRQARENTSHGQVRGYRSECSHRWSVCFLCGGVSVRGPRACWARGGSLATVVGAAERAGAVVVTGEVRGGSRSRSGRGGGPGGGQHVRGMRWWGARWRTTTRPQERRTWYRCNSAFLGSGGDGFLRFSFRIFTKRLFTRVRRSYSSRSSFSSQNAIQWNAISARSRYTQDGHNTHSTPH
jgi:hypothetical protein